MTEFLQFGAGNVVALRVEEKLTTERFDAILEHIQRALDAHEKVRLYIELPAYPGMSLEAFFKDLKFGLKNWRRFEREAVVTDKQWMHKLGPVFDRLFPGVAVKVFGSDETDAARSWIEEGLTTHGATSARGA